jgi:hypothetical protein
MQLTEAQKGYIKTAAWLLAAVAALAVPDTLPHAIEVRAALVMIGGVGGLLQRFIEATPEQQQAILGVIQTLLEMPPEQRAALINALPQLVPLLGKVATATAQAPAVAPKIAPPEKVAPAAPAPTATA